MAHNHEVVGSNPTRATMYEVPNYPEEILGEDDDNGTMPGSLEDLEAAVVGHKIVSVEAAPHEGYYSQDVTIITLDNGKKVKMIGESDCCAYTDVQSFLLHPDKVDHMIMGVGTTEGFTEWHIYCDYGDILELEVGWSCGNPFYYGYGFTIQVED